MCETFTTILIDMNPINTGHMAASISLQSIADIMITQPVSMITDSTVLVMLSTLLRDNLAFEDELKAMTTEGRMQAIVMSALPLVMLVLLGLVKLDLVAPLFTTAVGWCALGLLFTMQAVAYFWIRKIVDIKV